MITDEHPEEVGYHQWSVELWGGLVPCSGAFPTLWLQDAIDADAVLDLRNGLHIPLLVLE